MQVVFSCVITYVLPLLEFSLRFHLLALLLTVYFRWKLVPVYEMLIQINHRYPPQ